MSPPNFPIQNGSLGLDQCLLNVVNDAALAIQVYGQSVDCFNCDLVPLHATPIAIGSAINITLDTRHDNHLRVLDIDGTMLCESTLPLSHHNIYKLNITSCGVDVLQPDWTYTFGLLIPLVVTLLVSLLYVVSTKTMHLIWKNNGRNGLPSHMDLSESGQSNNNGIRSLASPAPNQGMIDGAVKVTPKKKRVMSLDAFRGFIMVLMIFVNYGAGGYAFLEHTTWFNLTIADVVFPSFIFVMGVTTALSLPSSKCRSIDDLKSLFSKMTIRSLKMFLLGVIFSTDFSSVSNIRIPGVLQRFAVSYLVVGSLHLLSSYRLSLYHRGKVNGDMDVITTKQMAIAYAPEVFTHAIIYGVYLYFTHWFSYWNDCPPGYLGPGGHHDHDSYFNCTGGSANYIDHMIFGSKHLYQTPTSMVVYGHTMVHDPEGLMGSATSILLCFFGLIAGRILVNNKSHRVRFQRWFILLLAMTIIGIIWFMAGNPIVKNLWTSSFIFLSGSFCLGTFLMFYFTIDWIKLSSTGCPFHFPGTNAILIYIGHEGLHRFFPFFWFVDPTSHLLLMTRSIITTIFWILIARSLYNRKIFWSL